MGHLLVTVSETRTVMLAINPQDVWDIIDLARAFHARESVVGDDDARELGEDWALELPADQNSDPGAQILKEGIQSLEKEQQATLVALMWLGRGDFSAAEWDDALDSARRNWTDHTADYLIGSPLVADYLEEGLSELGYSPHPE